MPKTKRRKSAPKRPAGAAQQAPTTDVRQVPTTDVRQAPTTDVRQVPTPDAPPAPAAVAAAAQSVAVVQLEPSLEVKDVEAAHAVLKAALERGPRVTVDVGRILAVDTAGIQLLLAFQIEAAKRSIVAEFCGASSALERALDVLGLRDQLHIAAPL